MVNDGGYMMDIETRRWMFMAEDLHMDWKECREMYTNLHEEVRQELDKYLVDVRLMDSREHLRHLKRIKNLPSTITKPTTLNLAV